ncbi:hypothetical protein M413DRAFT_59534 [Hebeloma cylindrosporum]|uniref:FAS1 domain-containing protein n=1 Tax=Hebeloma cylindrosporum TaxID=76867 RepID=A0A0C3CY14_HEBCY|nr:hypothetical protein M413DRAFT_59534 [Hebeloma cylindrosporum h7]
MHFKSLWLSLGIPLGSCLVFAPGQDHQVSSNVRFDSQEAQQTLDVAAFHGGSKAHTGTVYGIISNDPRFVFRWSKIQLIEGFVFRFSLITKALNFVEDVASFLNDSSSVVTFFAPSDRALRRSDHEMLDEIRLSHSDIPDHERRKKILKTILRSILNYHIIPATAYDVAGLGRNTTYPTGLKISGTYGGQPLRLRVSQNAIPPSTHINIVSSIVRPNIEATNGIIHEVDHPLLPPLSVFQELYMTPHFFSILTSALQRSNLTKKLDIRYVRDRGLEGTPLVTIFAPTNRAFERPPQKLKMFLFSPWGEGVLAKLLQYHVVPEAVIHSSDHPEDARPNHPGHVEPIASHNLTLRTLLVNHTIHAYIVQNRITFPFPGPKKPSIIDTRIFVNRHLVLVPDIVGFNGAIHVIDKLLDPRKAHHCPGHHQWHRHGPGSDHHPQNWEDWESWLPQWAEQG